jgi:hypothetical protein
MRLYLLVGCVVVAGLLNAVPVGAQIQPGGPYLGSPATKGSPGPKETETKQQVRLKTAACRRAADRYKLRGDVRKKYLDQCMALIYSGKDFKPPDKPS